jgi:RNA polymerase sigma-B factor
MSEYSECGKCTVPPQDSLATVRTEAVEDSGQHGRSAGSGRNHPIAAEESGGPATDTVTLSGGSSQTARDTGLPYVGDACEVAPQDARELSRTFLRRLSTLDEGTHEYQYVRNTLIEMNQSLVRFAISRFRHRGAEEAEDIFQTGVIGLIKAIDRFDLSREVEFTTFALPYIRGEIRRHLRDTTWAVHVPRRLQELRLELSRAKERLEARLGREPTASELAAEMGVEPSEAVEAMKASNGYTAASLDVPADQSEDGPSGREPAARAAAAEDPNLELFENFHSLAPLIADLDEKEIRLLRLRFGEERTQREIGDELGYSQMHISRRLAAIYDKLRAGLLADG